MIHRTAQARFHTITIAVWLIPANRSNKKISIVKQKHFWLCMNAQIDWLYSVFKCR